jgi:hypothetical protein
MDFAEHAHARSVEEVAAHFGVSLDKGLDEIAVARQRAKHGRNELPVDEGASLWFRLVSRASISRHLVFRTTVRVRAWGSRTAAAAGSPLTQRKKRRGEASLAARARAAHAPAAAASQPLSLTPNPTNPQNNPKL